MAIGDKISTGSKLGSLETTAAGTAAGSDSSAPAKAEQATPAAAASDADLHTEVVVLGAGPGGYTAAFRAADLGKKVVLIERYPVLGGVCLNVGCIPSKALLHTAQIINEAEHMKANGVDFGKPKVSLKGINGFKNKVVGKLTGGLSGLAKQRKIKVVHGVAQFIDQNNIQVDNNGEMTRVKFGHCIIAAGSQATEIPPFPNEDARLMDSTDALE